MATEGGGLLGRPGCNTGSCCQGSGGEQLPHCGSPPPPLAMRFGSARPQARTPMPCDSHANTRTLRQSKHLVRVPRPSHLARGAARSEARGPGAFAWARRGYEGSGSAQTSHMAQMRMSLARALRRLRERSVRGPMRAKSRPEVGKTPSTACCHGRRGLYPPRGLGRCRQTSARARGRCAQPGTAPGGAGAHAVVLDRQHAQCRDARASQRLSRSATSWRRSSPQRTSMSSCGSSCTRAQAGVWRARGAHPVAQAAPAA